MTHALSDTIDRYLVLDDTDEDIGHILTVISERSESARHRLAETVRADR